MVVKCRDVSIKDISHGQMEREAAAVNAVRATRCRHMQQYLKLPENKENQTLHFHLEGHNDQDAWKLNYQFLEYAPLGNLQMLITNHQEAKRLIPEHFCWVVFRYIVEALITCQTGYCSELHKCILDANSR